MATGTTDGDPIDPVDVTAAGLPLVTYDVYPDCDPFSSLRPGPPPVGDDGESDEEGSAPELQPGPTAGSLTLLEFTHSADGPTSTRLRLGEVDYVVGVGITFGDGYRIDAIAKPRVDVTTPAETTRACLTGVAGGDPECSQVGTVVCDGHTTVG